MVSFALKIPRTMSFDEISADSPTPAEGAPPPPHEVTRLLLAWKDGDPAAFDRLVPIVYSELHRLAHRHMRGERSGHLLQTTALVHEAYFRLAGQERAFVGRGHFFAIAAQVMRRILVDLARRKGADKRGGGITPVPLDENDLSFERSDDLIRLDDALDALAKIDARRAKVIELRYFGGLSNDEAAEALDISRATVERDLAFARAWLQREMGGGGEVK